MNASAATPRKVVEYTHIVLPSFEIISPETLAQFQRTTTLLCQGGDVLIYETECTSAQIAAAFKTLFLYAEEVVFQTREGEMVLLFSHYEDSPLRPREVSGALSEVILRTRGASPLFSGIAAPPPSITIDLVELMPAEAQETSEDELHFIQKLAQQLTPAYSVTLEGSVSQLKLFAACLLMFSQSAVLEWKAGDQRIRIA